MTSDDECIKQYLKGDQMSFEILYERYRRQLYSYLNRLVYGQPHLADDLYQQTWIKAIDNFNRYKEKGTFLAWLFRIAHNLFVDYCRKNSPIFNKNDETIHTKSTPHKEMETKEFDIAFEEKIQLLKPDQREVFLLRQNNISFKEIARIQKTGINTVLGRMRYAVEKLRESLKEYL